MKKCAVLLAAACAAACVLAQNPADMMAAFFGGGTVASVDNLRPMRVPMAPNMLLCMNVSYGPRQVGAGAAHADVAQLYDLVLPAEIGKIPKDAPVFVYIHGGAWAEGSKSWGLPMLADMAGKGFVGITMNYTMNNPKFGEHTFAEMLADIDALVSHLPKLGKAIGVDIKRFAIGGSSAGGHLSLLYAYDAANPSVMGLHLAHKVPVACVLSDCGPTDLVSPEFTMSGMNATKTPFKDSCMLFSILSTGKHEFGSVAELSASAAKFSPVSLVKKGCPPTICVYGETEKLSTSGKFRSEKGGKEHPYSDLWKIAGSKAPVPAEIRHDGIVPTQNYTALTNALKKCSVPYDARIENASHTMVFMKVPETRTWAYECMMKHLGDADAKSPAPAKK